MRPAFLILAFSAAAMPAIAQAPDWGRAARAEVRLSSFAYSPETIRLRAGQPVVLRFVNVSDGGHNFVARKFFAAAAVRSSDRAAVAGGKVELKGGESRDVGLVPKAGRYKVKCTHTFHAILGMTGEIVVE